MLIPHESSSWWEALPTSKQKSARLHHVNRWHCVYCSAISLSGVVWLLVRVTCVYDLSRARVPWPVPPPQEDKIIPPPLSRWWVMPHEL